MASLSLCLCHARQVGRFYPLPRLEESYTAVIVSRPSDKNEASVVKIRGIFFKKVRGLSRPSDKNETSVGKIRGIFFKKVRGLSRPRDKNETSVVKIRGIF